MMKTLAQQILQTLQKRRETLCTAESCTGGLIATVLTNVPGASGSFLGGVVAYSSSSKHRILGIESEAIRENGTVSEPITKQMAHTAKDKFASTWSIAVTGLSGPDGATDQMPIGTTCLAIAGPGLLISQTIYLKNQGRSKNREAASKAALEWLAGYL